MTAITAAQVKQKALDLGFHKVGIAAVPLGNPTSPDEAGNPTDTYLQAWLDQGYQADMDWMANPKRQDISTVLPGVQSVICVAVNYYVPEERPQGSQFGKIARYAWGRDYHKVISRRLKALTTWLAEQAPDHQARWYVDTGPIQDKVWAERAGLGWIAKNSNLITREYGSWVFLGEVLTTLPLASDRPHTQHCGTCRRCLEACPTAAIAAPFVIDATRCIAYHTIENRAETLPDTIVPHLQGWVAGCDICQDVCPWNQRFAQATDIEAFHPQAEQLAPDLTDLATLSEATYDTQFQGSALRRIKPYMWRRNAQACLSAHPPKS